MHVRSTRRKSPLRAVQRLLLPGMTAPPMFTTDRPGTLRETLAPVAVYCTLLAAACGGDSDAGPGNRGPAGLDPELGAEAFALEHDFGIVPHGEQRAHEWRLPVEQLELDYVPLRVHLDCSCGTASIRMRKPDGSERSPDGTGMSYNLPLDDEKVFLRIELDTRKKEAVDVPRTASRGYILLQPADNPTGTARTRWPFVIHFGIDAPVVLQPFASIDFERVPISGSAERLTTLRGDDQHPELTFGKLHCSSPDLEVTLEPDDAGAVLRARVRPSRLGNDKALIAIETSLDGYVVAMEARWKAVADLEARPIAKISFVANLTRAQDKAARLRQFVLVTDHVLGRSPEFEVREVVDDRGNDASSHFECLLTGISGQPRQQRLQVRYLGGLTAEFRGRIVLGKPGLDGAAATLPIELVLLPSRTP